MSTAIDILNSRETVVPTADGAATSIVANKSAVLCLHGRRKMEFHRISRTIPVADFLSV